jgi:hypothetical protein
MAASILSVRESVAGFFWWQRPRVQHGRNVIERN